MPRSAFPSTSAMLAIVWVISSMVPLGAPLGVPRNALAATEPSYNKEKEASTLPTRPSAPPVIQPKGPSDYYKCQRTFTYAGKVYDCDSNVGWDGERLRPILNDVPEAVSQLDLYQANRTKARTAAYIGTTGLLLTALGFLAPKLVDPSNTQSDLANAVRNVTVLTGIGVMVGGFTWALRFQRENDQLLSSAIDTYNKARPNRPLEVQFSTQLPF